MSSNYRRNKAFIDKYRKELRAMLGDISDIDVSVLNKAVNEGLKTAKELTNVSEGGNVVDFYTRSGEHVHFTTSISRVGGMMRKSWDTSPTTKARGRVEKELFNTMYYAPYVNYGHRIVQGGVTKGWVKGQFMLERAIKKVEKELVQLFKREVERVNRKHDK